MILIVYIADVLKPQDPIAFEIHLSLINCQTHVSPRHPVCDCVHSASLGRLALSSVDCAAVVAVCGVSSYFNQNLSCSTHNKTKQSPREEEGTV